MAQVERFWHQLGVNPAGQRPPAPASPAASPAPPPPPPPPAPPPAAGDQASWISQLRQLAQLHQQGVLSDDAYAAAKRHVLEQDNQPRPPGPPE